MRRTTLRRRLDAELVRRGLATGRDQAKRLIEEGSVLVDGAPGAKAATLVHPGDAIVLLDPGPSWASRGGVKLAAALDDFGIDVTGLRALDVGASTGGFSDVLLSRGAGAVTAVDVGYGQLVSRLANDPRVTVVDRTNFRTLDIASLDPPFDIVVVDVSFISVTLLAENLAAAGEPGTRYLVLVKPQFEAGREAVGTGGIVSDVAARADAVERVADSLADHGVGATDLMTSPITGAKGNVEFLLSATFGSARTLGPDSIEETVGA
jgi:23S rRNA (cytidine1920-2'-O)/16S rRNA (cytidine1409-2'-O)-methyltransferase